MITRYLLIISLCSIHYIDAQKNITQVPDSLKNKDFDSLFESIENEKVNSDLRSIYLKSFLIKAKTEENWEELSNAYKNYVHHGPKMLKLFYADSMVIAAKKSTSDKIIGSAYLSKGIAYYGEKRLSEALDFYLFADDYISKTGDHYLIHKTKYQIALIKYYLGYYDEAIEIFLKCIDYFKSSKNVRAYLNSLHSLGLCYKKIGNHELCSVINERGLREGVSDGNTKMEPYFIHSEGVNQCMIHNYNLAIQKIESSLPGIIKNKDFSNEAVGYFYLGKSYWELGNKEKAITYFKIIDRFFIEHNYIRPDISEAYEFMISYYKDKNLLKSQLYYVEQLLIVDKTLHNTYSYLQGKITREYDTKVLIKEQKKLNGLLKAQKYNDRVFMFVICLMLLLMIYGIIRFISQKKDAKKKYNELMQKIENAEKTIIYKNEDYECLISKDAQTAVLNNLKKFENGKKFLERDLNLTKLASYFNTNTKYLSLIILRHRNKKFNEYINCLKVEYIAQKIRNNVVLRNYTHESLAEEAGFSSTRRFVKAFVKCTGITPKYFIEELNKEDEPQS